jgi:hypothetical protein
MIEFQNDFHKAPKIKLFFLSNLDKLLANFGIDHIYLVSSNVCKIRLNNLFGLFILIIDVIK